LPAIAAGRLDLACRFDPSLMTAGGVDQTATLFDDVYVLLTEGRFEPKSWTALDVPESRLAFERGSPQTPNVERLAGNATITGFRTRAEAIEAVLSGRSDGFLGPVFVALLERKRHPQLAAPVLLTPPAAMPVAGVVAADADHRLRDAIDAWCRENRGNGKLREWILAALGEFGIAPGGLPADLAF